MSSTGPEISYLQILLATIESSLKFVTSFAYYKSEVSFPTVLMDFRLSQNIYLYLTKIYPRCGVGLI